MTYRLFPGEVCLQRCKVLGSILQTKEKERGREGGRQRRRETEKEGDREGGRQRRRETEKEGDREGGRQRRRETEKERDREGGRQRRRETEKERDREGGRQRRREKEMEGDTIDHHKTAPTRLCLYMCMDNYKPSHVHVRTDTNRLTQTIGC